MKNRLSILISLFCFSLIFSCQNEKQRSSLYPIDSLVQSQIRILAKKKARLTKEATINGAIDRTVLVPRDTMAWSEELGIFQQLEIINKPVSSELYSITDGLFDPRSNLTVKEFSTAAKLPVKYLRIYYNETFEKPRKIEAFYRSENMLSTTARVLTMDLEQYEDKTILTSYSVQGGQKMILGDTVAFGIKGEIVFDR